MTTLPPDWKPDDATHAVRCLESWVKQGENLIKIADKGPWFVSYSESPRKAHRQHGVGSKERGTLGICIVSGWENNKNIRFIAPTRSLVPALIKGMTVVLRIYDRSKLGLRYAESGTNQPLLSSMGKGGLMVADLMITETAKSYAPDMAEAGFEVPK